MRVAEWEEALNDALQKHRDLAGAWGVSDCWCLIQDGFAAVTGGSLLPHLSGYTTEKAGFKLFKKHGFATVEDALSSQLTRISPLLAQRGDIGVIERGGVLSCGIFTALGLAVKTLYGDASIGITHAALEYHLITDVKSAFRVI